MRVSWILTTTGMFAIVIASGANIITAIKNIGSSATSLKSAAASWDGSLVSGLAIGASANNLLSNTNAGINVVRASAQVPEAEAAQVAAAMKELADAVEGAHSTIVAVKPKVAALGLQAAILNSFKQQRTAVHGLGAAIIPKMPASHHAEALTQTQRIDSVFAELIKAYS